MVERMHHREDEENNEEKEQSLVEQRTALERFVNCLRTMNSVMGPTAGEAKPIDHKRRVAFEVISGEKLIERHRNQIEATTVMNSIHTEGFSARNFDMFLRYIEAFSASELELFASTIDDLLREWDPTLHGFLQNAQAELRARARLLCGAVSLLE